MNLKKHIIFLKDVLLYTLTAFGGPQGHIGMMHKKFVIQKKYLTEEELFDYFSFCQLLPGASSTQTIGLIGYKKGGLLLSILTLIIWITPACLLMGILSFILSSNTHNPLNKSIFQFIQPMAIGFLIYTIYSMYLNAINNTITITIAIISTILTFLFFKSPWVFPLLIITSGLITNISNKRFPDIVKKEKLKIRWEFLILFISIFLLAALLSETARKQNWENRKTYNLFENFYRFGSIVFGGGDVLLPMMVDQYIERPLNKENSKNLITINKDDLITGYGIVRIIPGPVFSIGSFVGGIALKSDGKLKQISGSILGTIALFLPSTLILFFLFPIYENFKKYSYIHRALEGIKAVVVGLLLATFLYLIKDEFSQNLFFSITNLFIIFSTFLLLRFTKIHSPIIVILCLLLGWIF